MTAAPAAAEMHSCALPRRDKGLRRATMLGHRVETMIARDPSSLALARRHILMITTTKMPWIPKGGALFGCYWTGGCCS